jgi:glycosyltransferase involved in cell wall biosynthesis
MEVSIIIFCYNEAQSVATVVGRTISSMAASNIITDYEIIVVNDGSTDGTFEIIESIARSNQKVRCIHHARNMGIGMALRSGYEAASLDYVCAIPGDGQFDTAELAGIKPFDNKVFYSFFREETKYGPYRCMLTLFNKTFNTVFLGLHIRDVNWIKVYRKEQLLFADPQMKSSLIESEISAKLIKAGARCIELPSIYQPRRFDEEKGGSWKTLKKALSEMWWLYFVVGAFNKKPE